ncbi:MAG: prenyltransferase/squalene oxidase repeat-containing protein [Planctomycetaceae bacterium]
MIRVIMILAMATSTPIASYGQDEPAISPRDKRVRQAVTKGLDYLAREQQESQGYWEANGGQYRVAMTALAGLAMLAEGSTPNEGKYATNVRKALDYILEMSRENGLIGFKDDYHYTYGHGFSMLFLSQVYGEEDDVALRQQIKEVLTKAVQFCADAQTSKGGWGYISAKEGNDFDEGSTCITQVQGLRACRNSGIPVDKKIIDDAKKYIRACTTTKGGVQYSIRGGGERPPITAAALAAMFNAGEYESDHTRSMLKFCEKNIWPGRSNRSYYGHWHYTHFYYSQVMYRGEEKQWKKYFSHVAEQILRKQSASGAWKEGHVGAVYTTAINCIVLQMDNGFLPIFQK